MAGKHGLIGLGVLVLTATATVARAQNANTVNPLQSGNTTNPLPAPKSRESSFSNAFERATDGAAHTRND